MTPDRIVEARVVTANALVQVKDISVSGNSLRLSYRPAGLGQHVVGVQLNPRNVRQSPASFRRYLDLEGAPEARQRYERAGLLSNADGDSITRRYAKYAKTIVEVGRGARAFHRPLDHRLEFVPLSDPSALRPGDTLRVRLLLLGKSAPLARLHSGSVAVTASTLRDTAAARLAAMTFRLRRTAWELRPSSSRDRDSGTCEHCRLYRRSRDQARIGRGPFDCFIPGTPHNLHYLQDNQRDRTNGEQ